MDGAEGIPGRVPGFSVSPLWRCVEGVIWSGGPGHVLGRPVLSCFQVGTDSGNVSIDCVFVQDDETLVNQFENITINYGSKLNIDTLKSEIVYFDLDGDETK